MKTSSGASSHIHSQSSQGSASQLQGLLPGVTGYLCVLEHSSYVPSGTTPGNTKS